MLVDVNGAPLNPVSFAVGDAVTVTVPERQIPDPLDAAKMITIPPQVYQGDVISTRGAGATLELEVRYAMPGGRKPFYDVWWPIAYVSAGAA